MKKRYFLTPVTVIAASLAGTAAAAIPESAKLPETAAEAPETPAANVAASVTENPFVLMRPDSSGAPTVADHYSHSSHSSHSSHRSHYSGY